MKNRFFFIYLIYSVIGGGMLAGCKSLQPAAISNQTDSIYIEKLICDTIPGDTVKIYGWIDCDSILTAKLNIKQLSSNNSKIDIKLDDNNNLDIEVITPQTTTASIESYSNKSAATIETISVPRKRTIFEKILITSGIIFWLVIATYIIAKFIK